MTADVIEFVFVAFKTLLRDRSFGFSYCPNKFLECVVPAQTIQNLVTVIKNESNEFSLDFVLHLL